MCCVLTLSGYLLCDLGQVIQNLCLNFPYVKWKYKHYLSHIDVWRISLTYDV